MPATTVLPRPTGGPLPLFVGLLRSESRKLHTVRSTFWALLAAVAFNVLTAGLLGALLPGHLSAHQKATIDSVRVSLGGLHLSQVAIGLLGVLAVTGEYSSGMIRATLAAVPQHRLLLTAKALVFTAAAAATGIAACLAAYLVFQAFLPAGDAMRTTLADPGVLRGHRGRPVPHGPGPARLRARHRPALQRRRGRGLVRRAVRAHPPSRAAAVIVAGHHRPLTADERRRCHLHHPPRGAHALAMGRIRRVLPVRGGGPGRRVRPDRTPRRVSVSHTKGSPC